jgi:DNA polymerase-3 subunit delta
MDSLAFLEAPDRAEARRVYVLHGDEDFLKRQALAALQRRWLGDEPPPFALASHAGDRASFPAIADELHTLPFLSPCRVVVVENADPFVTANRSALEKYAGNPSATGVLVLVVKSWTANTNLAKMLDNQATLTCKAPAVHRLPEWCARWSAARHGKELTGPAGQLLVDYIGPEMGLLDQELAKLAVYVGTNKRIDRGDVDKLVGNSRAEDVWKTFNAIAGRRAGEALTILGRLLEQGDDANNILGAFRVRLRPVAKAYRLTRLGRSLDAALQEAGVPPFAIRDSKQLMQHLGQRRLEKLYDWLVEVELGLKGSSPLPPRLLLERLVVRLAREATGSRR